MKKLRVIIQNKLTVTGQTLKVIKEKPTNKN